MMAKVVAVSRKEVSQQNFRKIFKKCNLLTPKMESGDYNRSLVELSDCLTDLHNLVKQPFRGLIVPEQVIKTFFFFDHSAQPLALPPAFKYLYAPALCLLTFKSNVFIDCLPLVSSFGAP